MRAVAFRALLVMIAVLAGAVASGATALAASPKAVAIDGGNAVTANPTGLAMDAAGKNFVVVVGAPGTPSLTHQDIFVYTLQDTTSEPTARRVTIPSGTPPLEEQGRVAVAVASTEGAATGFAVAGWGNRVFWYDINSLGSPKWSDTLSTGEVPVVVGVTANGGRVALGVNTQSGASSTGKVLVYPNPIAGTENTPSFTINAGGKVLSMAFSKGSRYMVGTDKSVLLLDAGSDRPLVDFSALSGAQALRVAMSDDGNYGAAVTLNSGNSAAAVYLFNFTSIVNGGVTTFPKASSPASQVLDGTPQSLAVDGAGRYVAVGKQNGRISLFENRALPGTSGNRELFPLGADANVGAEVKGLAFSKDSGILLATAGSDVLSFHVPAGATGLASPLWKSSVGVPLIGIAASRDGKTFGVAGASTAARSAHVYRQFSAVAAVNDGPTEQELTDATGAVFRVRVENRGSLPGTYVLAGNGPTGWSTTLEKSEITLAPGASSLVNVTFIPPAFAAPGVYPVTFTATPKDGSQAATASLSIRVTSLHNLVLKAENNVTRINLQSNGPTKSLNILVENRGNVEERVTFDAIQRIGGKVGTWTVAFEPSEVTLAKGAVQKVAVKITPAKNPSPGDLNQITVVARGGEEYRSPGLRLEATVNAAYQFTLTSPVDEEDTIEVPSGEVKRIGLALENTGNILDTYRVYANVTRVSRAEQWRLTLTEEPIELKALEDRQITLSITPTRPDSNSVTVKVEAISMTTGAKKALNFTVERKTVEVLEEPEQAWYSVPGFDALLLVGVGLAGAAVLGTRRQRS